MKKELTITLNRAELLYDVENKLHLLGINRENGNTPEGVSHIQADETDSNRNEIQRNIQDAIGALHHALHEYLVKIYDTDADNLLEDVDAYIVVLAVPMNFDETVLQPLADLLHQYVVNTCLLNWLLIADKADAAEYATAAAANLKEIDSALAKRKRPLRPTVKTN